MTAYLNNPLKSEVRTPRGCVKVNGNFLFWDKWEVNNNTFYQADSFTVTIPLSGQPNIAGPDNTSYQIAVNEGYWGSLLNAEVEIFAGFPPNPDAPVMSEMQSLIVGGVDQIDIGMVNRTVTLTGRDYTSRFIDTKTTKKWQNLTPSEIATELAIKHNLGISNIVPNDTKAGVFYTRDYAKMESERTEWDLLCTLAHEIGYEIFVKGFDLYFRPITDSTLTPYLISMNRLSTIPSFDGMDLKFSRNLTLSRDVIVYVRSWNEKHKKGFNVKRQLHRTGDATLRKAAHNKSSVPVGVPQVYSFIIPNLSQDQAIQQAEKFLHTITQHEMKMYAKMPADNILFPGVAIQVEGTGVYDQIYYADSVTRTMDITTGYLMELSAKNHNTDSYKVIG